ncbi:MAG: MBL fold metallo-hydrolase, partial [Candidatus Sumerlaeia bacterium]|nr:MBL fold metallo-hydrolase [Candidatus Sumerlaeia bacterium]
MIKHHTLPVGPLGANCYILQNETSGELVVVDPGDDAALILQTIKTLGGKLVAIWNTHGHIDHVNGNADVKEGTGAPISIHEKEADWLGSAEKTLAVWAGVDFNPSKADTIWKDGDTVQALGLTWKIRHTPGHSPGMCCIISEDAKLILA